MTASLAEQASADSTSPCTTSRPTPVCPSSFLHLNLLAGALLFFLPAVFTLAQDSQPFELFDGDRVVMVGDTLIEREVAYGHLELRFSIQFPDRQVTFRNLGWSADTPLGQSRAGFNHHRPPATWFKDLTNSIALLQPTVLVLGYGMAASFEGPENLTHFADSIHHLIHSVQLNASTNRLRWIVLGPVRHEQLPSPLPDPARHNSQLSVYNRTLKGIAEAHMAQFVDLFGQLPRLNRATPRQALTDNGIHLNDHGYRLAAIALANALNWPAPTWPQPAGIGSTPASQPAEDLRQAILKKNQLFFHRWRPQNNTYLFLFRKREQGRNAIEIPQFDPLIAQQEKVIAQKLRSPSNSNNNNNKKKTPAELTPTQPTSHHPLPQPKFDLDPNLEITLYAQDPLIAKPIHMNFDARGRLWIASSEIYPQIKPGQEATDKIVILEDVDADGRADKSTVFASGLLIPTGILPGDRGAYVAASTELLHLQDSDGDGIADQRRVVLSGFGTEDTHHILHTLRWGHDGQLYMNQSIYIHTHTETPHGVIRLNSGGILSLRVPTMELGIHLKGIVNCWGHAIDDFGQSFVTDGASSGANLQGGLFHVVPQAMYISYSGARRRLTSVSPGSYPKFASLEFIRSPHFPDDWQGNFVTCDFRAHRIVRFAIDEHQSSYVTREMPDLVRSTDVAFRPVDVKLGPDGALYIADWSNPIIQHGEVDFRDPRRDHVHGRIWRVTHKKRPVVPRENLEQSENLQLLDNLLHANLHTQQQSRRLLAEKGAAIVKDLRRWIKIQSSEIALLQGLWMYQSVDRVETRLLKRLLNAKDGRIRAAAVRVLAGWIKRTPGGAVTSDIASSRGWSPAPLPLPRSEISTRQALQWLGSRIEDDHPQVRLETLRALARIPVARSAELALSALTQPMDPHLDYALWLTINDLADPWIDSLKNRSWKIQGHEDQLAFGLKSLPSARAAEVLSLLLPNPPIARDGSGPWIDLIAEAGTPLELQKLYDQTLDASLDYPTTARALAALDQAATTRNLKPPGDLAKVTALFDHPDSNVQVEAIRLAGQWQSPGNYLQQLGSFAGQESTPPQLRQASFATLRQLASAEAIATLSALAATGHPANIRREAVLALAAIDFTKAVPTAIELLNGFATEPEALAFWRSLLRFKGASKTIAQALPIAGIPTLTARTGLRAAREGGRTEPDLVLALTRGSGIEDGEVSLTPTELKQLASDVLRLGDPARGESVYRRNSLSCVACHAIGGAGGKVGPDLTSIGASAPVDYLIESVWFPHKKIKEGYHAVSVETDDGEEFSGVLLEENPTLLVLRDTTDRELSIAKNRITNRRMSTLSLMPAGLLDPVPAQDRIDLFRFLSELGKPGPFDGAKPGIARLWRLRRGTHNVEQFGVEKLVTSDLKNRAWLPLCSDVNGSLPAYRIRETVLPNNPKGLVGLFAATQLQLSKDSQITLGLQSEPNAIWINGKSHTPATALTLPLAAGTNTIVLRLDPQKLPPSLRLEASMGTFLTE